MRTLGKQGRQSGSLGGGQLARMLPPLPQPILGFRIVVLALETDCPAAQTANSLSLSLVNDRETLIAAQAACDGRSILKYMPLRL